MGRREDLIDMRKHLIAAMEVAEPNVLAQVIGQLRAVVKELDELPDAKVQSSLDKAVAKRAARRSNLKAV